MSRQGVIIDMAERDHTEVLPPPFRTFFLAEFPKMVVLAEAVSGNPAVAEDLAAEAMTRAHRRWPQVGQMDRPGAWLRRVTINLAISERRRRSVERRFVGGRRNEDVTVPGPDVDHPVWAAVASLPSRQRAAVALYYLEDLSVADIGRILRCSESTATTHLHNARRRLGEELERTMGHDQEEAT